MSIINEAIKRARKEFELKRFKAPGPSPQMPKEEPLSAASPSSDIKWTAIIIVSLVVIVSLLGSIVLYRHLSRIKIDYSIEIPAPKDMPASYRENTGIELNGIVYGPDDKWAIINDRIVREGDALPGGELTYIAKEFVKIRKANGEEVTLDLK